MRSIELLKAFNDIDDTFLLEADGVIDNGKKRIVEFKRYLTIAGSVAALLAVAVNFIRPHLIPGVENEQVQVANPMTECSSIEEASGITGFDMSVPDNISGNEISSILVYSGTMIEVNYGDNACYIRKEAGDEDISGDYNVYGFTKTTNIGDVVVTIKGDGELAKLATWTCEGFSYALYIDKGVTLEEIGEIIESIR